MLPDILTDFNGFIDGVGYIGRVKELQPPKITKKMIEVFNGGMAAPVDVPVGWEKLMAYMTFEGTPADIIKAIKKTGTASLSIRFVGTFFDPNGTGTSTTKNLEIVLTGAIKEMDPGTLKRGEQPTTKFEFCGVYYKATSGSDVLVEIDALKPFVTA